MCIRNTTLDLQCVDYIVYFLIAIQLKTVFIILLISLSVQVLGGDNDSDIDDEDGEKVSRPPFANTEGKGLDVNKSQKKQAQGQ